MTTAELIAILAVVPADTEVLYKDMNFGGLYSVCGPSTWEFEYKDGKFLMPSAYWDEVD